jgi:hypothetical protein
MNDQVTFLLLYVGAIVGVVLLTWFLYRRGKQ